MIRKTIGLIFNRTSAVLGIALVIFSGLFYFYYQKSQEEIENLRRNNAKFEEVVKQNQQTIKALERDIQRANRERQLLNDKFSKIRQRQKSLSREIQNFDLEKKALENPKETEKTINKKSKKLNRCLEIMSGQEPTEAEKNVSSKDEENFNSECPWIHDSN